MRAKSEPPEDISVPWPWRDARGRALLRRSSRGPPCARARASRRGFPCTIPCRRADCARRRTLKFDHAGTSLWTEASDRGARGRRRGAIMRRIQTIVLASLLFAGAIPPVGRAASNPRTPEVAVGPQYDTTHVYVSPDDFDRF